MIVVGLVDGQSDEETGGGSQDLFGRTDGIVAAYIDVGRDLACRCSVLGKWGKVQGGGQQDQPFYKRGMFEAKNACYQSSETGADQQEVGAVGCDGLQFFEALRKRAVEIR